MHPFESIIFQSSLWRQRVLDIFWSPIFIIRYHLFCRLETSNGDIFSSTSTLNIHILFGAYLNWSWCLGYCLLLCTYLQLFIASLSAAWGSGSTSSAPAATPNIVFRSLWRTFLVGALSLIVHVLLQILSWLLKWTDRFVFLIGAHRGCGGTSNWNK